MNIKEAIDKACEFDDLRDALTSIALWETERIVDQAVRNTKEQKTNPDGSLYETFWGRCFDELIIEYPKAVRRRKNLLVKDHVSNLKGVDGLFRFNELNSDYILVGREHGDIDFSRIIQLEDLLEINISTRYHQGRDINEMFEGAEKLWLKSDI